MPRHERDVRARAEGERVWEDALRTGRNPVLVHLRGHEPLEQPLLNKDTAFTDEEREVFGHPSQSDLRQVTRAVAIEVARAARDEVSDVTSATTSSRGPSTR